MPQELDLKTRKALTQLAREQSKYRLMCDIRVDIEVCILEGWDYKEYLEELKDIIDGFLEKGNGVRNAK